jgi:hypothetical protein
VRTNADAAADTDFRLRQGTHVERNERGEEDERPVALAGGPGVVAQGRG